MAPNIRLLSPPLGLVPPDSPPELFDAALRHFGGVPWCADLLRPPAVAFVPSSRNPQPGARQDRFIGATLAGPRALRHMLCLFRPDDARHAADPARPVARVTALCALGDDLCGYEGLVHGGLTATLIDETLGVVGELNAALGKTVAAEPALNVTAALDIRFLRPVPADADICVTAWAERVRGRKTDMRCEVTGPGGELLATAESVWVAVKPRL